MHDEKWRERCWSVFAVSVFSSWSWWSKFFFLLSVAVLSRGIFGGWREAARESLGLSPLLSRLSGKFFCSLVASFLWSFNTHTSLPHGRRGMDSLSQGCLVGFSFSCVCFPCLIMDLRVIVPVACWLAVWRKFSCAGFCSLLVRATSSRIWRW